MMPESSSRSSRASSLEGVLRGRTPLEDSSGRSTTWPCPNPGDLLPKGKIAEARASYEEQIEHAVKDMVYVASRMYEAGADGINFDTTAAAGDAEFCATL